MQSEGADGIRTGKCFNCRGDAAAYWMGYEVLEVCEACATEVLPALIADAIDLSAGQMSRAADTALARVVARFWRAVATRLMFAFAKRGRHGQ